MFKKIAIGLFCLTGTIYGQATSVNWDSGGLFVYNENTGGTIKLSGGSATDGNGFVLQLGYFSGATVANNFGNGTFIPLTGEGALNTAPVPFSNNATTYNQTTIGDVTLNGGADGEFWLSNFSFVLGSPTSGNNLPPAGTPLSISFFNGTTIAGSTFYNAVSNDAWAWAAPAIPTAVVNVSLADSGLEWYSIFLGGNSNTAFHTTILVPEPSTLALLAVGALGFVGILRRRKS
jgi:hypothetical protein